MLGGRSWRAIAVAAVASVAAATLATAPPAAGVGEPVQGLGSIAAGPTRLISPGVEVFELTRTDGPLLHAFVARIAPDVVRTRLRVVVSNDAIAEQSGARREQTSSMCRRYRCVVGVNADQWYVTGSDVSTPIGGTVVDGELWRTPEPDANPFISIGQLQWNADGELDARAAPPGWTAAIANDDGTEASYLQVNRIPLEDEISLYTYRLGNRTPDDPGVSEWVVEVGPVVEGLTTVRLISGPTPGGSTLRPGQGAIAARGADAVATAGAILFDGQATVGVEMDDAWQAVGGFPVLMEDGEYAIFPDDPGNAVRDARTVAGWTADGTLLLVTADERPAPSAGLSIVEAARLLRTLGAVEAINLDGGGSTTFVQGGFVTNRPSDGTEAFERSHVDALVVVPPEGIDFATPVPRVPAAACPAGQVPAPPFDDLSGAATHLASIACAAWRWLTGGVGVREFAPTALVTRAQMAVFVTRLLQASGRALPDPLTVPDAFDDDDGTDHEDAINALASMQIVTGFAGGGRRFDPAGYVTRAQMATFLARALFILAPARALPPEHDYFSDDPLDVHQPNINVVAELGVAGGVGGTQYNPGGGVSRAQMATFLVRALDVATAP